MASARAGKPIPSHVAHYLELFAPLGVVTARSMFGEYGFFCQGVMFALTWQDGLFVRVDESGRARHEARGLRQFVYVDRNHRPMPMPYFEPPPEALDEAEAMTPWSRPALESALAARAAKAPKRSAGGRKKRGRRSRKG